VQKRVGVYADKAAHPEFGKVLLLTSANAAYFPVYRTWECWASRHGLDWAVIANDDEAYRQLGPDRGIAVIGEKVSGMVGWGSAKLDHLGRNKYAVVLSIMRLSGVDVMFSDADNMFHRDPFAQGVSLGDLIRSQKYDYVYQEELQKRPDPSHVAPGDGGNTGFWYAAGSRKPHIQTFLAVALADVDRVQASNDMHIGADQNIFWNMFNDLRNSHGSKQGTYGFKCASFCGKSATCEASSEETLDYCNMDPIMHPTGWEEANPAEFVTYHANYVANEMKIKKLEKMQLWGIWDANTGKCTPSSSTQQEPQATRDNSEEDKRIQGVVQKRVGVYADKAAHPEFGKVLLLTSANAAYLPIYYTWRCWSKKHGLDWAVIANDDEAFGKLDEDRGIAVLGEQVRGMVGTGSAKLDKLGRNKYAVVLRIMRLAAVDVVFSDADNMFLKDPFARGVSLGDLIRSQKYDYIYQEELQKRPDPGHVAPGDSGNTGFWYAAGSRKPNVQIFLAAALAEVDRVQGSNEQHLGADQSIFWTAFNDFRNSHGGKQGTYGFRCASMCGQSPTCEAAAEETLAYCNMDPIVHPAGWEDANLDEFITYHANYATNQEKKNKLKKMTLWGVWNKQSGKCKV